MEYVSLARRDLDDARGRSAVEPMIIYAGAAIVARRLRRSTGAVTRRGPGLARMLAEEAAHVLSKPPRSLAKRFTRWWKKASP